MRDVREAIEDLAEKLAVEEERRAKVGKGRRADIEHSLTIHRSGTTVKEIEAMIAHLRKSGMPEDAELTVTTTYQPPHTRLYARWRAGTEEETPL